MSDKKELEVISGDGSNLDISPVYGHLTAAQPKSSSQKPKNIVIPHDVKSGKKEDDDDDENDDNTKQSDKKEP